jgi:transposase-like protein
MPKPKPPYPREYRQRIVDLVRSGRTLTSLEEEFGCTATSIRNWVRQAELDAGHRTDGLTSDERAELSALRRRVKVLEEERDILSKAAAWFAQEAAPTPKRRSGS